MREVRRQTLVPHTAQQMYDIVNDIARYPEFLPWCTAAVVQSHTDTTMNGTLTLSRLGVAVNVTSANTMVPGRHIGMTQIGGPLQSLVGTWDFTPIEKDGVERGSKVELWVEFAFKNAALTVLFAPFFELTWDSLVDAFIKRARDLYGVPSRS